MNILDFLIIRGQQVFEEGRDINLIKRKVYSDINQIKRKYIVENSDSETDSPYKSDYQGNEEKEEDQYPEIKEKKLKTKTVKKTNQNKKQKLFE